jgi:hypothetical protein
MNIEREENMKVKDLIKILKRLKQNDGICFDVGYNLWNCEITEQKMYSEDETYVQILPKDEA